MRCLFVVTVVAGWFAVVATRSARAQEENLPPPGACARSCANPIKVIVHVPKPEIVVEDTDTTVVESGRKHCLFKHKPRRAAAPPPQTIGMIVAPTAAVVPAAAPQLAGAPVMLQSSCATPAGFTTGDQAAMRAAHELELNLARLSAARAAQRAEMDASDAAIQRAASSAAQMTSGARPVSLTAQADTKTPTPESLARTLQSLTERVDTLDQLVRQHHRLLQQKYPEAFK